MALVNVTEKLVLDVLNNAYIGTDRLPCSCDQCIADILAIALNRIPANYATSDTGYSFVKAKYFDRQSQMDVVKEVAKAVQIVAAAPRHEQHPSA